MHATGVLWHINGSGEDVMFSYTALMILQLDHPVGQPLGAIATPGDFPAGWCWSSLGP